MTHPRELIVSISPPKCGTTGLFRCLARSQDVAAPTIKEARFFIGDESARYPGLPAALRFEGNLKHGLPWFWNLFPAGHLGRRYAVDFTTYYALSHGVVQEVGRVFSRIRAILIVRDPVDRFVSHYWQYRKMGIALPPLGTVIRGDDDVARLLFDFADYRATYERWTARFGADAVLVIPFPKLRDPAYMTERVRAFLDLPDFEYNPTRDDQNVAGLPRLGGLQSAMFSGWAARATRLVPAGIKPALLRLRKRLVLWNTREQPYPPLGADERAVLHDRLATSRAFYEAVG